MQGATTHSIQNCYLETSDWNGEVETDICFGASALPFLSVVSVQFGPFIIHSYFHFQCTVLSLTGVAAWNLEHIYKKSEEGLTSSGAGSRELEMRKEMWGAVEAFFRPQAQ
jgi:hypothetical protein